MSFLIVDDNSAIRRTLRYVVGEFAGEIVECGDGAEAFAAYEKLSPDWVLMDVEMPRKDGLTATREIRAAFADARIVIVTKHGDAAIREAARDAGACAFVVKENLLRLREILTADAPPSEQ
ncbi:MAG: response regulator transcription factor [Acidobacteria bacterium]|nr:response regulator transcription factor [Acidobacteriota bacterium]